MSLGHRQIVLLPPEILTLSLVFAVCVGVKRSVLLLLCVLVGSFEFGSRNICFLFLEHLSAGCVVHEDVVLVTLDVRPVHVPFFVVHFSLPIFHHL